MILLHVLAIVAYLISDVRLDRKSKRCLHYGCDMSAGLYISHVDNVIDGLLPKSEFKDNLLTMATWNVGNEDEIDWKFKKKKICNRISDMQLIIFGLQDLHEYQLNDIKSCLPQYSVIDGRSNGEDDEEVRYNPIFFKKESRLRLVKNGTFTLKKKPYYINSKFFKIERKPSMCTWARLSFAERITPYSYNETSRKSTSELLLRELRIMSNKIVMDEPRVRYKWYDFYVAVTHLSSMYEYTAKEQAHTLTQRLKDDIMERRAYPVVLMGDIGWEDNSPIYDMLQKNKWLSNTMEASKSVLPAMSFKERALVDYIWQNKFKSLLSAIITDTSGKQLCDHYPVLAALLPNL